MSKVLFLSIVLASFHVMAEEDSCGIVLDRAAANISYRFGSATAASTQANSLCDEKYDKMSASEQQGLEAQYEVFKGSYSSAGTSLKEFRSKYCTSGKSTFFSTSQSTEYSSQIYESSVAAWRDCKAMQIANVIISPVRTPDDRSVVFSIAYRGPGDAKLTGVRVSPKSAFSCTGDGGKKLVGSTNVPLNGNSYSLDCIRVVTPGKGPNAFTADASSITITTSASSRPLMLYFPAVANPDLPSDNAVKLRTALSKAEERIQSLENSTKRIDDTLRPISGAAPTAQQTKADLTTLSSSLKPTQSLVRLKENHTPPGQNASCFDVCRADQSEFKASCLQTFVPYQLGLQVAHRAEDCFTSYQDSLCLCGPKRE